MSVKSLMTFLAATASAMSMTVAQAGGVEYFAPRYAGIYLEANLGYAHLDWRDYALGIPNFGGAFSTDISNTVGGFSAGADLGYQFNEYWSLEGGWYYLPQVHGTVPTVPGVGPFIQATAQAWFAYVAAKLLVPIYHGTYIFGKFGTAYRRTRLTANMALSHTVTGQPLPITGRYWAPFFAVGIQYYITWNWSINAQYMRLPGYNRFVAATTTNRVNVPAADIITAGVAYKFAV